MTVRGSVETAASGRIEWEGSFIVRTLGWKGSSCIQSDPRDPLQTQGNLYDIAIRLPPPVIGMPSCHPQKSSLPLVDMYIMDRSETPH
jgi:hypothetical protein